LKPGVGGSCNGNPCAPPSGSAARAG
jgi:hypothetical protein